MTPELKAAIAALLAPSTDEGKEPLTAEDVVAFGMWVPASLHVALAELLKAHGFTLYVTVVASHWPGEKPSRRNPDPPPEHFQVATVLRNPTRGASTTFSWRVRLEPGQPLDTLFALFAGADWQEREQYDLVGVHFAGHPDLRRLMMPDDWEGHPLRRDYAIDTPHFPWR